MITETVYKKTRNVLNLNIGSIDSKSKVEAIQTQLDEARFVSNFMAAICALQELDGICSIAARALYEYAPYSQVVFTFSEALDSKTFTFSPRPQKVFFTARPKITIGKSSSHPVLHETSLASTHLILLDNLGTIDIYGQSTTFSASLIGSISAYFSQAVKNALEHSKMKELALRDGLTGLFNRRMFDETLTKKVTNPEMNPVSLIIIDLDNFKQINDTFGHQSGDQVLKTFAKILKESCRGHDIVTRFGGEEFAIILSHTKAVTAHTIAHRIKNRLAKTIFTFGNRQLQMTASIGLATSQEGSTIFTSNLVNQADRALYQAKRTGKNKVCVFPYDLLTEEVPLYFDTESFCLHASASC